MSTASEIRKLRKRQGWTQKTFASKVGVIEETVSRWERGLFPPLDPQALIARLKELLPASEVQPLELELTKEEGSENRQQAEESQNPSQGIDSSEQAPDLYFDLPAKRRLWEQVMADSRRLLSKSMRGYTNRKFLSMDPFLLADRMDSVGSNSARQWVELALKLPGDFPATNEESFFRLIAQHQFANAGFGSAKRAFYGEE